MTPPRPIVRYHGGKWMLAPWIISHFPDHRTYVEPFGGGASVLLRKPRSYAEVYNDLDEEMVNLFRVARWDGNRLLRALKLTPFARCEFDLSYEPSDDPLEQARRTVIRSFMGFGVNFTKPTANGRPQRTGFRSKCNRRGTTPAQDWRNYPDALAVLIDRLQGVVIENRDAREVMQAHDGEETLHYVDPPYVPESRDKGHDYRYEMSEDEHVELIRFLEGLQGYVVLSGYPSDLYDRIISEDRWVQVKRTAHADGGRPRTECLWLTDRTYWAAIKGEMFAMEVAT